MSRGKKPLRAHVKQGKKFDESRYEINDKTNKHPMHELVEKLRADPNADIDAIVLAANAQGHMAPKRVKGREAFLAAWDNGGKGAKIAESKRQLREAFDSFGYDTNAGQGANGNGAPIVGQDYIPILGGPFNKQMYMYDALKMYALAFQAFHHDPFARAIINITRDFPRCNGCSHMDFRPRLPSRLREQGRLSLVARV